MHDLFIERANLRRLLMKLEWNIDVEQIRVCVLSNWMQRHLNWSNKGMDPIEKGKEQLWLSCPNYAEGNGSSHIIPVEEKIVGHNLQHRAKSFLCPYTFGTNHPYSLAT